MAKSDEDEKSVVLISEKTLRALMKENDNYKGKIDGLVGELRETIGNAVEKKHLNKTAFALMMKFHRAKSDEKMADDFRTFLAYMDMGGVTKRIDAVPGLPLDGERNEAEAAESDGKVTPIRGRQVAESAGAAQS